MVEPEAAEGEETDKTAREGGRRSLRLGGRIADISPIHVRGSLTPTFPEKGSTLGTKRVRNRWENVQRRSWVSGQTETGGSK